MWAPSFVYFDLGPREGYSEIFWFLQQTALNHDHNLIRHDRNDLNIYDIYRQHRAMFKEKFRQDIAEKVLEKGRHKPDYLEREMKKWKEDMEREHGTVPTTKNIDFFVTNVEFTRNVSTSSWRIREGSNPSFPFHYYIPLWGRILVSGNFRW